MCFQQTEYLLYAPLHQRLFSWLPIRVPQGTFERDSFLLLDTLTQSVGDGALASVVFLGLSLGSTACTPVSAGGTKG